MSFSIPGLLDDLCRAAEKKGYDEAFPVQLEVIPHVLEGKDLSVSSETGSGKTDAFILPIIDILSRKERFEKNPNVLILVPTRELAIQVGEVASYFAKSLKRNIRAMTVYGGVSINPQLKSLAGGTEILISTPGRLLDIIGNNGVDISSIEILVLDEADRMLDLGFKDELTSILKLLPENRQNLLFSATMKESMKSSIGFLKNALSLGVKGIEKPAEPVKEICYRLPADDKGLFLRYLIKEGHWFQVLVFASSKRRADNITRKLCKNGITAEAFHGDKSQGARTGALTRFKKGKIQVLVATDLASRGIDIQELPHVVNYELPRSPADYVHRIGRTGRAGVAGIAVTLLSEEDEKQMKLIEKKTGAKPEYINSDSIDFK